MFFARIFKADTAFFIHCLLFIHPFIPIPNSNTYSSQIMVSFTGMSRLSFNSFVCLAVYLSVCLLLTVSRKTGYLLLAEAKKCVMQNKIQWMIARFSCYFTLYQFVVMCRGFLRLTKFDAYKCKHTRLIRLKQKHATVDQFCRHFYGLCLCSFIFTVTTRHPDWML